MNDFNKDFDKYMDLAFGSQKEETKNDVNQHEKNNNEICETDKQKKENKTEGNNGTNYARKQSRTSLQDNGKENYENLNPFKLNYSEKDKDNLEVFRKQLEEQKKIEETPEYQEALAKRNACFSPKVERLFAGYLLLRGMITEDQAKEYLKKAIPNAKECDLEPERFENVPEEIKNSKIHVKTK